MLQWRSCSSKRWLVPVATKVSHRQFKHPTKPGRVTIAGHPSHDLAPGTYKSIMKQAGLEGRPMRRSLIVIERAERNFSAYSPDLPGCIATGSTRDDAEKSMLDAIQLHVDGLVEDGLPVPESRSFAELVVLPARRFSA